MAKPICVIYVKESIASSHEQIRKINNGLQSTMEDYYVFVLKSNSPVGEEIEFEVFFDKDFTDINYEELKKIIEDSISESDKTSTTETNY